MGDDDSTLHRRQPLGNMLDLIVLRFDDGREMVTHAIPMRTHYHGLLPPTTDDDIERMANEAEAGYDLTTLRPRGGRPPMGSGGERCQVQAIPGH